MLGGGSGKTRGFKSTFFLICIFGVLLLLGFWVNISIVVLGYFPVISVITFLVYAKDKKAAQKGNWRTEESMLHFLALIGGWPGALMAQRVLRHKSRKLSFLLVFWITVVLNVGGVAFLLSPDGPSIIISFLREWG